MIVLEATPSQSLSVVIVGRRFDLRIFDLGGAMAADVSIDNVPVLTASRLVAGTPFIPFDWMEDGNLILVTDGAEPDWRRFGVDQWLVELPEAAGPRIGPPVASGGGAGPGPGPGPDLSAYLRKDGNLAGLTDLALARANLGFQPLTRLTADTTVADMAHVLADTSAGPWTLTLPEFGSVEVYDVAGTWPTNNLTIVGPVRGSTGPLVCDKASGLRFVRLEGAANWSVYLIRGVEA